MLVTPDLIIVTNLGSPFYELGKLVSEQLLALFIEFLSGNGITSRQEITGLGNG